MSLRKYSVPLTNSPSVYLDRERMARRLCPQRPGEIPRITIPDDVMVVGGNVLHALEFVADSDSRISLQAARWSGRRAVDRFGLLLDRSNPDRPHPPRLTCLHVPRVPSRACIVSPPAPRHRSRPNRLLQRTTLHISTAAAVHQTQDRLGVKCSQVNSMQNKRLHQTAS